MLHDECAAIDAWRLSGILLRMDVLVREIPDKRMVHYVTCYGFAAGSGLLGLNPGEYFFAITSSACAILESSASSLSTPIFVMFLLSDRIMPAEPGAPIQPLAFPGPIGPFVRHNELHHCASEVRAFEQDENDTSQRFSRLRESVWQFADCCNPGPQV